MAPFVSIICPVYNAAKYIDNIVPRLLEQDYPAQSREIIFVDNGSTDDTVERLKKYDIQIYSRTDVASSYAARNLGIKKAKGEILAFIDADCTPTQHWLSAGAQHLLGTKSDLVAGRVEFSFSNRNDPWEIHDASFHVDSESLVRRGMATTANLFVQLRVFLKVGLFLETATSGGDAEWSKRATQNSFSLHYCKDAVVFHPTRNRREALKKSLRIGAGFLTKVNMYRGPHGLLIILYLLKSLLPANPANVVKALKKSRFLSVRNFFKVSVVAYLIKLQRSRGLVRALRGNMSRE